MIDSSIISYKQPSFIIQTHKRVGQIMDKNNKILRQIFIKRVGQIDKYKPHSISLKIPLKILMIKSSRWFRFNQKSFSKL